MNEIVLNLSISGLTFIIGYLSKIFYEYIREIHPFKKLWKLKDNQNNIVNIITANTPEEYRIDVNEFAITGYVCEYLGASIISTNLKKAYKNLNTEIYMEFEDKYKTDENLVLIGGPK